jgi:hypothetical protein
MKEARLACMHVRVCAVQPVLLSVVQVENSRSFRPILRQQLNHLQQSDDAHAIVRDPWRSRYGIVVCAKEDTSGFQVPGVGAIDFDDDIGSLKVDADVGGRVDVRHIGEKVIRDFDARWIFSCESGEAGKEIRSDVVVGTRIVGMWANSDLPSVSEATRD